MQTVTSKIENNSESLFSNVHGGKQAKTVAENIFKDLKSNGFADKDIVAISSEILDRLTEDIKRRNM